MMADTLSLRQTFDSVALLYNEIRPRYPEALFKALVNTTKLSAGDKILEIGPGTGQATKPLAERGYEILGVELGAEMARVASHELNSYPHARILTGAFEDIALPADTYNLVLAATSFHWINPEVKFSKPCSILRKEGHLAIIHTHHISDNKGDEFFKASLPIFDRFNFIDVPMPSLPSAEKIGPTEIDDNLFHRIHFECFRQVFSYSAGDFAKLLNTYSNHLAAPRENREAFLAAIKALINTEFGGKIEKHFLMSLTVAQKVNR